jgi:hypothetical protein
MNKAFTNIKPYLILTADAIISNQEPLQVLFNDFHIVMIDNLAITVKKSSQFTPDGEIISIPCPVGYHRFLTTCPLIPIFFAKSILTPKKIMESDPD